MKPQSPGAPPAKAPRLSDARQLQDPEAIWQHLKKCLGSRPSEKELNEAAKICKARKMKNEEFLLLKELADRYPPAYKALNRLANLDADRRHLEVGQPSPFTDEMLKRAERYQGGHEPVVQRALAARLRRRKQYEQSLAVYQRLLTADAKDYRALLGRARVYVDLKRYKDAVADCDEAFLLKPDLESGHTTRARALFAIGETDRALADLTRSIELSPDNARAYYNRAVAHRDLKQLEKSVADFTEAIKRNPTYHSAYLNRGGVYYKLKQIDKAEADFTRAIETDPSDHKPFFNRAMIRRQQGKLEAALSDYKAAQSIEGLSNDLKRYAQDRITAVEWEIKASKP